MRRMIITILLMCFVLSACAGKTANDTPAQDSLKANTTAQGAMQTNEAQEKMKQENTMKLTISGVEYEFECINNSCTEALAKKLPLKLEMQELHGNEKYAYLDFSLPTQAEAVGTIQKGDIMLFGNDCLVIFYKSFSTSYSYTKIGHIQNAESLEAALGSGNVSVEISD